MLNKFKKCVKCGENKQINEFYKNSQRKSGISNICKVCEIKIVKKYYLKNREKQLLKHKEWLLKNKEYCKEYNKIYYQKNLKYHKEYRKKYKPIYYKNNREFILKHCKEYYQKNKKIITEKSRAYAKKNRKKLNKTTRRYIANRFKKDTSFKLSYILRCRIRAALKNDIKKSSSIHLLGCSVEDFKKYIESLWKSGMAWNNWGNGKGKWQIDHIIPCMAFDLSNEKEQKKCFNYKNQQPLWHDEHVLKSTEDKLKFKNA